MVNGINTTGSISAWLSILNQQKTQTSGNSSASGMYGAADSVQLSGQSYGANGSGERVNPLDSLVSAGTITSEQAEAIDAALRSGEPGDGTDNPLASLIADGTITQDQADSVKSTLDAGRPRDFMSSTLDSLVSAGTLTQEQADAVSESMKQGMQGMQGPPPPPPPEEASSSSSSSDDETYSATELASMSIEEILKLLSSGSITSQEALKAIEGQQDNSVEATGSSTANSAAQAPTDPLDGLVADGTITQDQADAIQTAFRQAVDMGRAVKAYSV